MSEFSAEKAKKLLEDGAEQAKQLLQDPSGIDNLLITIEEKLKEVPVAGTVLAKVPLMIAMVKAYITKEYTEVSPKVIITLVSSFLYLIKKKDLIPDNIPLIGHADDLAVIAAALMLNEPELNAFSEWRKQSQPEEEESGE